MALKYIFVAFCVTKIRIIYSHYFWCTCKYNGNLKEKHLWNWVGSWIGCFSYGTEFLLDRVMNELWLFRLGYLANGFLKNNWWDYHFKKNLWYHLLPMIKLIFQAKERKNQKTNSGKTLSATPLLTVLPHQTTSGKHSHIRWHSKTDTADQSPCGFLWLHWHWILFLQNLKIFFVSPCPHLYHQKECLLDGELKFSSSLIFWAWKEIFRVEIVKMCILKPWKYKL